MYVQTYGTGFFDETLRSKKWHIQLLLYDKAWTKLARSKIRKGRPVMLIGSLNQIGTS